MCIDIIKNNNSSDSSSELLCGTIQFIMAARTLNTGKSKPVHQLKLTDTYEIFKHRYKGGAMRAIVRKEKLKFSLQITPPKPDEVEIIHNLYHTSRELKKQKNMYLMGLNITLNTPNTKDDDKDDSLDLNIELR